MPNLRAASFLAYLPAGILLLGGALVLQTRAQRTMVLSSPLKASIPPVAGYTAYDQEIGAEERRVAGMTEYVARAYSRDSNVAFTTLVSYYDRQGQGKTIHSPKNCLPGAGWEVLRDGRRSVDVGGKPYQLNHYMLKNGGATAVVYYWYQGRGRVVASEYAVKWNLLRDAALLGHTEEALVRIVLFLPPASSGSSESQALAAADSLGDNIARQLIRDVAKALPGNPAA